jgi:ABC-type oligopeptide transport system substrate-binding subunit
MKQRLRVSTSILSVLFLFVAFAALGGCGSDADLETQLSGKWQRSGSDATVDIQLAKNGASLALDGHVYTAVVENVDRMTNTVKLKVNTDSGQNEEWSLHQMWDDNGSSFTVNLTRNGATETLRPVGKS